MVLRLLRPVKSRAMAQPAQAAVPGPTPVLLAPVGQVEPYDPNGGIPFSTWFELFEEYCLVNRIPAEPVEMVNGQPVVSANHNRMRALFLSCIGQRNYALLHNMCLPDRPAVKPIPVLVSMMMRQFEPPGLIPANRLIFHSRRRRPDETVSDYVGALQVLAKNCHFGTHHAEALRDQMVCGIGFEETQRKLLQTPNLTYELAKQIALQDEAVRTQSRRLAQATNINAVQSRGFSRRPTHPGKAKPAPQPSSPAAQPPQSSGAQGATSKKNTKPRCRSCTGYHQPKDCPARSWTCHGCGKVGHIAKKCPRVINHTEAAPEDNEPLDDAASVRSSSTRQEEEEDASYINSLFSALSL